MHHDVTGNTSDDDDDDDDDDDGEEDEGMSVAGASGNTPAPMSYEWAADADVFPFILYQGEEPPALKVIYS